MKRNTETYRDSAVPRTKNNILKNSMHFKWIRNLFLVAASLPLASARYHLSGLRYLSPPPTLTHYSTQSTCSFVCTRKLVTVLFFNRYLPTFVCTPRTWDAQTSIQTVPRKRREFYFYRGWNVFYVLYVRVSFVHVRMSRYRRTEIDRTITMRVASLSVLSSDAVWCCNFRYIADARA